MNKLPGLTFVLQKLPIGVRAYVEGSPNRWDTGGVPAMAVENLSKTIGYEPECVLCRCQVCGTHYEWLSSDREPNRALADSFYCVLHIAR